MQEGVEGFLRDKTRKPGKPPLPSARVQRVIELALGPVQGEGTLDGPNIGEGSGHQLALGATHPGGPQARPAPHPQLQALQGPEVRREAQGHRRPRSLSSGRP